LRGAGAICGVRPFCFATMSGMGKQNIGLFAVVFFQSILGLWAASQVYGYWSFDQKFPGLNSIGPLYFWSCIGLSTLFPLGIGLLFRSDLSRRITILAMALILAISTYRLLFHFYMELLVVVVPVTLYSGIIICYLTRSLVKARFH